MESPNVMTKEVSIKADRVQPLDGQRHYIRLIKLLPRKEDGALRLELHEDILLEDGHHPPYTALSYEWGPPHLSTAPVLLNGKSIRIRWNLYYFLRDLLKHHQMTTELLWVDSLCIDQTNTQERNHQVQHMKHTYAKASHVLAWIGPPDEASKVVFRRLNASNRLESDEFGAFLQICSRSYWSRMWIIQEICLARRLSIVCGRFAVSWRNWHQEVISAPWGASDTPAGVLSSFCQAFHENIHGIELIEHILVFRHFECSQKHDKVYALLGLIPNSSVILVDYGRSIEELLLALLAGIPREQALPPLQHLAEVFEVSLKDLQLRLTLALRVSGSFLMPGAILPRDAYEDPHLVNMAIASFLESPYSFRLFGRDFYQYVGTTRLPSEWAKIFDVRTAFCCHCILCQIAGIKDTPSTISAFTTVITHATMASYRVHCLSSERVFLLYAGKEYIATYTLSSVPQTLLDTSIPSEADTFYIIFRDPYLAHWLKMNPNPYSQNRTSWTPRLAMPYISVMNLILHQTKTTGELTRMPCEQQSLGYMG